MKNVKIKIRILLLSVVAIIGLLAFSGYFLAEKWRVAEEMERLSEFADLASVISALVHEMQKERGASAGFIGSKGAKFAQKLTAQRKLTEDRNAALAAPLAAFDAPAYGAVLVGKVAAARKALAELDGTRKQVSDLAVTVSRMARYYTATIAKLLSIIEETAVLSTDAKVTNAITAYTTFLQGKERAGLERAMGSVGFSAGAFEPAIYQRFLRLIAMQDIYFGVFDIHATGEQKQFFKNTVTGAAVDEVARLRKIAIDSIGAGDTGGVEGPYWFDTITEKIDLLKAVEDRIAADLKSLAAGIRAGAEAALYTIAFLSAVLLAITIGLSFYIALGITNPVKAMTEAMLKLAGGDESVDIPATDRKDEVGEMAGAVQVFKENMIKFRTVVNNSPAKIHITDATGRYTLVNRHAEKLFGVTDEEARGKAAHEIFPAEIAAALEGHDRAVLETGQAVEQEEEWPGEGGIRTYLTVKFPILDASGRINGVGAIGTDVTERKHAELQVRQLQADIVHVSRLSAMGEIASAMTHELNQPLTAIMNYLQACQHLMKAQGGMPEKIQDMIELVVDQADRAGAIIHRIREFIEKGETARSVADINDIVGEACALAMVGAAEMKISPGFELTPRLPPVLIDKIQIQQVVFNLVRNAVDALEHAETRELTLVSGQTQKDAIEVAVRDTGPGIPLEVAPRLFQPFVTSKADGMGIGLSISRSIIEAHGGRLWATSNRDGGTTFHFTVPVAPRADKRDGDQANEPSAGKGRLRPELPRERSAAAHRRRRGGPVPAA